MMLESTEREVVVRILSHNFLAGLTAAVSLQVLVGADLAAQIPDSPNAQIRSEIVVTRCEQEPWRAQGDHVLIDLLKKIVNYDPGIPPIISRLRAITLPPNPLYAQVLDGGRVFLGREDFRKLISGLVTPAGCCVIRINGERKWGKSYSFHFLKFLSMQGYNLRPIQIENPGATTHAKVLAETLLRRMGCALTDIPNIENETPLRAGQLLADWVLNLALRSNPRNWWFVLDDFDQSTLPDDTKEFIRQIALRIYQTEGRLFMRLVLIDYKSPLPRDLKRLQTEEILCCDREKWISRAVAYYDQLSASLPPERRPSAAQAKDETIADLRSVADKDFLETLCDALEEDTDVLTPKAS